ncbi:MAG: lysophospholipid acyltransferase family protein [Nitrospiria bacterium]
MKPRAEECDSSSISRNALAFLHRVRGLCLIVATLILMTITAIVMLAVAVVTLFRARRFYAEVLAKWPARMVLWLWGIRFMVHQDEPFPEEQTVYISNHTSTLDVFILVALGLPNTRFFFWGGTRKWIPLTIICYLIGTFYTPSQKSRADRVRCFQTADRVLRRTGDSVYLSPEGVRVTTGEIGPFNKGAFHLATSLGVPMVPLYIKIPREINPGKGFVSLPGMTHVYVKPAIPTDDWKLEDLVKNKERVREYYLDLHQKLQ